MDEIFFKTVREMINDFAIEKLQNKTEQNRAERKWVEKKRLEKLEKNDVQKINDKFSSHGKSEVALFAIAL